jgi:hypothetical protein
VSEAVENDYVATATAEKRLREVLAERFDHELPDMADQMAEILLAGAEITYLPRKRSVAITLRVPATAPTVTSKEEPVSIPTGGPSHDDEEAASVMPIEPGQNVEPKVARFGEYVPTVTSAPEYHDDDYFAG